MMTLHLTLKMTITQVVETSVTNKSLSKDYPRLDNHAKQITDTPGFKPFTKSNYAQCSELSTYLTTTLKVQTNNTLQNVKNNLGSTWVLVLLPG